MNWDGKERRTVSDHDTLIEVVQVLKNHVANFDKHVDSNKTEFSLLQNKIWEHARYIYIGIGIIVVLNVITKLR